MQPKAGERILRHGEEPHAPAAFAETVGKHEINQLHAPNPFRPAIEPPTMQRTRSFPHGICKGFPQFPKIPTTRIVLITS